MNLQAWKWAMHRHVRRTASISPRFVAQFYRHHRDFDGSELGLTERTEFVIDAYPRSANSYFTRAFQLAQGRRIAIAHHLHAAGVLIAAARRGVPAVTIIRDPLSAVVSLAVYYSAQGRIDRQMAIKHALWDYIAYYRPVERLRANVLCLDFASATEFVPEAIQRINAHFGTQYDIPDFNDDFRARVQARLAEAHRFFEGDTTSTRSHMRVPVPDQLRATASIPFREEIEAPRYRLWLQEACDLFEKLGPQCEKLNQVHSSVLPKPLYEAGLSTTSRES